MSFLKLILLTSLLSVSLALVPQTAGAGVLAVDGFLLSNSRNGTMLNPGIGLGYDFREHALTTGFSLVLKSGVFQDLEGNPAYYATAGLRYRYIFQEDYSIGAGIFVGVKNIAGGHNSSRVWDLLPLYGVELGRRIYKNDLLTLGLDLHDVLNNFRGGLFLMLSYGHSF